MDLKLQKRLSEDQERLFYVVYDPKSREYYDIFEFKRFKIIPILERTIFKYFSKTFTDLFSSRKYNFNFYKTSMFLSYNIQLVDTDQKLKDIEYKISELIKNIYLQIRWQDLYNLINSFKGKVTMEGVEALKEKLLNMTLNMFSPTTKELFAILKEEVKYTGDDDTLFRECLYLSLYDEYLRAVERTKSLDKKLKTLSSTLKNKKETDFLTHEEIKLSSEVFQLASAEI